MQEEWNDIYDHNRNKTGLLHLRGTNWAEGQYGLVVCVWVYDGKGKVLLTRRAPGKSYAGTWENSGGAVKAGESSREAIARELFEETGITASPEEFEYLCSDQDSHIFYDFYCLKRGTKPEEIVLLAGETDAAQWVTLAQVHDMIKAGKICDVIARQFLRQEPELVKRQSAQGLG